MRFDAASLLSGLVVLVSSMYILDQIVDELDQPSQSRIIVGDWFKDIHQSFESIGSNYPTLSNISRIFSSSPLTDSPKRHHSNMHLRNSTQSPSTVTTSTVPSIPSSARDAIEEEEEADDDDDDPIDFLSSKSKVSNKSKHKSQSYRSSSGSLLNPIKDLSPKEIESVTDTSPDLDLLLDRFNGLKLSKSKHPKSKRYPRKWPTRLTVAQQDLLQEELRLIRGDEKKKTYDIPGASCGRKELEILISPNRWLNDEIINFYGAMINNENGKKLTTSFKRSEVVPNSDEKIEPKVFCFSTFFMTEFDMGGYQAVERWSKKIDLLETDLILFPINHTNSHWTLGVINNSKKRFEHYDSLGGQHVKVYSKLRRYYKSECMAKKKLDVDLNEWSDYHPKNIPLQTNSYDCGVFVCQFMYSLSQGLTGESYNKKEIESNVGFIKEELFDFSTENMSYIRSKMAVEFITKSFIQNELDSK